MNYRRRPQGEQPWRQHMTTHEQALRALAQAYDREDAAQRGEPDPWNLDDPGDIGDSDTWVSERLACARAAAEAFLSALEPAAPEGRRRRHQRPREEGMKLTAEINCGDGAVMTIVDPRSFEDGGIGWKLRYGNPDDVRYTAASLIDSYDYLLSGEITMQEATRRLRHLRAARRALTGGR